MSLKLEKNVTYARTENRKENGKNRHVKNLSKVRKNIKNLN